MLQTNEQVYQYLTGWCYGGAGSVVINMNFHEFLGKFPTMGNKEKEELRNRCSHIKGEVALCPYLGEDGGKDVFKVIGENDNLLDVMIDHYNEKPSVSDINGYKDALKSCGDRTNKKDSDFKLRSDFYPGDARFKGVLNRSPGYSRRQSEHPNCHWTVLVVCD